MPIIKLAEFIYEYVHKHTLSTNIILTIFYATEGKKMT